MFDYSRQACGDSDIPDAPARAFRDADGTGALIASHYVNRQCDRARASTACEHHCDIVMSSAYDADPAHFEDQEWLSSPYTIDGRTVFALVHDEYQGYTTPGRCPSQALPAVLVQRGHAGAIGRRGATFRHARPAPAIWSPRCPTATSPTPAPTACSSPATSSEKDGYYYALVPRPTYRKQETARA